MQTRRICNFKSQRAITALAVVLMTAACATTNSPTQEQEKPHSLKNIRANTNHPKTPNNVNKSSKKPSSPLNSKRLKGLSHSEITKIFGKPDRVRNDGPAHVWQYSTSQCFVDIFMYGTDNNPSVTYVQERTLKGKKMTTGFCLNKIWERNHKLNLNK